MARGANFFLRKFSKLLRRDQEGVIPKRKSDAYPWWRIDTPDGNVQKPFWFQANGREISSNNDEARGNNATHDVAAHSDLNSNSHKRFCNRLLTKQGILLGHGESKNGYVNICRNRNFNLARDGIRTHDLRMTVVVKQNLLYKLNNINFTKNMHYKALKCSIVRSL